MRLLHSGDYVHGRIRGHSLRQSDRPILHGFLHTRGAGSYILCLSQLTNRQNFNCLFLLNRRAEFKGSTMHLAQAVIGLHVH